MKKRTGKLTLHRETLRALTRDQIGAAHGRGIDYTITCPLSGCRICSGLGCTGNCSDQETLLTEVF